MLLSPSVVRHRAGGGGRARRAGAEEGEEEAARGGLGRGAAPPRAHPRAGPGCQGCLLFPGFKDSCPEKVPKFRDGFGKIGTATKCPCFEPPGCPMASHVRNASMGNRDQKVVDVSRGCDPPRVGGTGCNPPQRPARRVCGNLSEPQGKSPKAKAKTKRVRGVFH